MIWPLTHDFSGILEEVERKERELRDSEEGREELD